MVWVGRLVPDGLWELFQRVVPAAPVRPQGGGRRRYGDREVLAAILFVATTGCTWRQLPPVCGPSGPTAHRRFTEWSRARVWGKLHRLVLDELGARGESDWSRCAIDSVNMRALKGGPDGSESRRSRQEGIKDPLDHRAVRSTPLDRNLRREHSRQPGPRTPRARHPAHPLPPRTASTTPRQTPWRQGVRLRTRAAVAALLEHHPAHRPQGHRALAAPGPPPLDRGTDGGLACRVPPSAPALRAQGRTLPRLCRHRRHLICHRRLGG